MRNYAHGTVLIGEGTFMIQKMGGGLLNLTATVSKMFESPKIIIVF